MSSYIIRQNATAGEFLFFFALFFSCLCPCARIRAEDSLTYAPVRAPNTQSNHNSMMRCRRGLN